MESPLRMFLAKWSPEIHIKGSEWGWAGPRKQLTVTVDDMVVTPGELWSHGGQTCTPFSTNQSLPNGLGHTWRNAIACGQGQSPGKDVAGRYFQHMGNGCEGPEDAEVCAKRREPIGQGRRWMEPGRRGCLIISCPRRPTPQPSTPPRIPQGCSLPHPQTLGDLSEPACSPTEVRTETSKLQHLAFKL